MVFIAPDTNRRSIFQVHQDSATVVADPAYTFNGFCTHFNLVFQGLQLSLQIIKNGILCIVVGADQTVNLYRIMEIYRKAKCFDAKGCM